MRRVRLRLWQVMTVIALIATLAFSERMRREWTVRREKAAYYACLKGPQRNTVTEWEKIAAQRQAHVHDLIRQAKTRTPDQRKENDSMIKHWEGNIPGAERNLRDAKRQLEYASQMRTFWERAAARIWLSVRTDKIPQLPIRSD
jgi:hypothetical protein